MHYLCKFPTCDLRHLTHINTLSKTMPSYFCLNIYLFVDHNNLGRYLLIDTLQLLILLKFAYLFLKHFFFFWGGGHNNFVEIILRKQFHKIWGNVVRLHLKCCNEMLLSYGVDKEPNLLLMIKSLNFTTPLPDNTF